MSKPQQTLTDEIFCENTPIWRPHTHELILQKRIAQHVRRDPQNPSKALPALGPLLYTCLYDPVTHTERILEGGHQLFFFMKCSDKGTYFGALETCKAEFKEIDSELVFTASPLNRASIWNLVTQKMISQFKTAQTSFTISPQETYIASDSEDNKEFLIRTLSNNTIVRALKKSTPPDTKPNYCPSLAETSCSFSSDDRLVAFADGNCIHVMDLHAPEQEAIRVPGLTSQFMARNLLLVPSSITLHLYNTNKPLIDGPQCKTFSSHCTYTNLGFSNNFQFNKDRDKIIGLVNVNREKPQFYMINLLTKTKFELKGLIAISPDFSRIATQDANTIYIKDVNCDDPCRILFKRTLYMEASHVFFSLNNEYIFFEDNSLIYIWNFKRGSNFYHKKRLDRFPFTNNKMFIPSNCSPDSQYLLIHTHPSKVTPIDLIRLNYIKNS